MISYTRNFEDVMIHRALKHIERGFFVDVGASHPVQDSNTYALYTRGWRGLAVEPQTIFNAEWAQHRPEDLLLNAALGVAEGELTLFKPIQYGQAATINPAFANDYAARGLAMEQSTVRVHTLTQVLLDARPEGDIHLLSIDVEGAERDVIAGLDWQRFRPWLVVLESTLPGVPTPNYDQWESLLLAQGYEFAYFDAVNRFYVAKERQALKAHFDHPPCVWDEFTNYGLQQAQQLGKQLADALLAAANHINALGDGLGYEQTLMRLFELAPSYQDCYWPIGALLVGQGRRREALDFYLKTVQYTPQDFHSHHNIGMLMRWEKRWAESEEGFQRMMEINPKFSEGRMNYGALLLALGRYKEGWALFESRYLVNEGETPKMTHNAPFPRWTGESLQGKSIMVMREQGYGDEIMFARFVQTLKERGAQRVSIMCQLALKTLLQTLRGVDAVVCAEDLTEWPMHDYWCYGQSLPHALGITLENLPADIPYLFPSAQNKSKWQQRLAVEGKAGALKVGITWRGSAQHGNDGHRSIPHLTALRTLWNVPNIQFISLQTAEAAEQAKSPPLDQPLLEYGSQMSDFADGAALLSELDLVISVDTAIVHLAGALGVPCWVMIPVIETDWRWLNDRADSPWYPVGMRIFRQTVDMEWDDVLAQVQQALFDLTC